MREAAFRPPAPQKAARQLLVSGNFDARKLLLEQHATQADASAILSPLSIGAGLDACGVPDSMTDPSRMLKVRCSAPTISRLDCCI